MIDFSTIEIGGEVSQELCEQHLGISYADDPTRYALALLGLLGEVRKYLKDKHHREITVRAVKCQLLILTDAEAARYNPKRFADGMRLIRRAHRRLLAVDVSKLTPEQRATYGRDVETQSARLSLLRKPREATPAEAVQRAVPKLFDGPPATGRRSVEQARAKAAAKAAAEGS